MCVCVCVFVCSYALQGNERCSIAVMCFFAFAMMSFVKLSQLSCDASLLRIPISALRAQLTYFSSFSLPPLPNFIYYSYLYPI